MKKKINSNTIFSIIVYLIVGLFAILTLYPLIFVLSASFSNPAELLAGKIFLLPKGFNFDAYRFILKSKNIMTGYSNTIIYSVAGTAYSLFLTTCAAYALSKPQLRGRNFLTVMITLTMFFGGGMIPTFLNLNDLGMLNTRWVMIIPSAMSATNFIIMRNYFIHSIPAELLDAAYIDGATELNTLLRIVLPISRSIIGVMTVFYMSGNWNTYFTALIYLSEDRLMPLQIFLRRILIIGSMDGMTTGSSMTDALMYESLKYAVIVVSTIPILILYMFVQKSFKKGIMMGSIKG
ncbi:MAG: carbohydrate ABC transporter permease [Lachnospiraceae bacterium]|nr:carbohydrate ABC transporter permease [Lachnospiraceae bacterium]